jgi:hypothetical protein
MHVEDVPSSLQQPFVQLSPRQHACPAAPHGAHVPVFPVPLWVHMFVPPVHDSPIPTHSLSAGSQQPSLHAAPPSVQQGWPGNPQLSLMVDPSTSIVTPPSDSMLSTQLSSPAGMEQLASAAMSVAFESSVPALVHFSFET